MEDLIARIAATTGIELETARKAVGAILAFLQKEGPKAEIGELFARFPGAADAAETAAAENGGMMSGLMAMMGGGLMGLAARLSGLGLTMTQMQQIGRELFAYAEEQAGPERVRAAAGAIPGLSQFL